MVAEGRPFFRPRVNFVGRIGGRWGSCDVGFRQAQPGVFAGSEAEIDPNCVELRFAVGRKEQATVGIIESRNVSVLMQRIEVGILEALKDATRCAGVGIENPSWQERFKVGVGRVTQT